MSIPVIKTNGISRDSAINDMIESVALVETALSNIINAEGEKIQATLGTLEGQSSTSTLIANNLSELITIDDSVNSLISIIATLETTLQQKLALIQSIIE